jgi:hypothetical protein
VTIVFLERFLLPLVVGLTLLIAGTNPMGFDWNQRISAALALICSVYFVTHTIEKINQANVSAVVVAAANDDDPIAEALKKLSALDARKSPPMSAAEMWGAIRPIFTRAAFQANVNYDDWQAFIIQLCRARILLQKYADNDALKQYPKESAAMKRAAGLMKNLQDEIGRLVWGNPQVVEDAIRRCKDDVIAFRDALPQNKFSNTALTKRNQEIPLIRKELATAQLIYSCRTSDPPWP